MPHIVLASQSPRRQELLGRMGIRDFSIVVPDVDESVDPSLSPEETVCAIARRMMLGAVSCEFPLNSAGIAPEDVLQP